MWAAILSPEVERLSLDGGLYSRGGGQHNVYTTNTTNILTMIHGMERINQTSLVSLSFTNIEQDLLQSLTKLILYPKVFISDLSDPRSGIVRIP